MNKEFTICLAGNTNTRKSSIFKKLTNNSQIRRGIQKGKYIYHNNTFNLINIPTTHSLYGTTKEDILARDFICFENNNVVIVICDAETMECNLNLVYQVLEYNKNVILVINLMDKANKLININRIGLMYHLGIPVVLTSTRKNQGIEKLKETILEVCENRYQYNPIKITYPVIENDKKYLVNSLEDIPNREMIAMRILDAHDSFFESLKAYYLDHEISIILELRKNYNNQEKIREYIVAKHFELSNDICEKDICYINQ